MFPHTEFERGEQQYNESNSDAGTAQSYIQ